MNIRELRKKYKLSQQALSDATGIPKGRINGWEQQGTNPKKEDYDKLEKFFENLSSQKSNAEIIESQGILGGISSFGTSDGDVKFIDLGNGEIVMFVPLIEPYAQAGYLTGFGDKDFIDELPTYPITVSRQHKGSYIACRVIGESMFNGTDESIPDKSVVVGRVIKKELWKSRFHLHKWEDYIIVHKDGILIKRITDHNVEKGTITISSLNPDKERYPDEVLNLDDCRQICNVIHVGVSRSTF